VTLHPKYCVVSCDIVSCDCISNCFKIKVISIIKLSHSFKFKILSWIDSVFDLPFVNF